MTKRIKDLTGRRFGRLTVLELVGINEHRNAVWFCRCDCGSKLKVLSGNLATNNTLSCGCLRKERVKEAVTIHGMSKDRLYPVWKQMLFRCSIPHHPRYKNYGGRGIMCCEDWKRFENFKRDMEGGYAEGLTLERINNDEGYSKDNCRWATSAEQNINKRNNINILHNGITLTLKQWAVHYGMTYETLRQRFKRGVAVPELFTMDLYSRPVKI